MYQYSFIKCITLNDKCTISMEGDNNRENWVWEYRIFLYYLHNNSANLKLYNTCIIKNTINDGKDKLLNMFK